MAKRKQITVYLNSKDDMWGDRSVLTTYKHDLADIYFLEDEDGHDFHYCINWGWNGYDWDECRFKTETEAIKYVCQKKLADKYESIRLRCGQYWNSENGAVTGCQDGTMIRL